MIGNIIWSEERPGVLFKSKAQGRRSRPRALPCTTASRWSRPYDYRSCQSLFCVVISLAGGGPKHGLGLVAIGRYLTFERSSVRKLLCAPPAASPGLWVGGGCGRGFCLAPVSVPSCSRLAAVALPAAVPPLLPAFRSLSPLSPVVALGAKGLEPTTLSFTQEFNFGPQVRRSCSTDASCSKG
jgi:hypothetical protein